MSLRLITPCDTDGICPYNAESIGTCEYWCGQDEPEESYEDYEYDDEEKNMKKYYIIPTDEIAMEINASDDTEAMDEFALKMDFDMNVYFKAVTEEEYAKIKRDRDFQGAHDQFIRFANDVLHDDFDYYEFDEETIDDLAEDAWDINCRGDGYTEYECIEKAIEEYEEDEDEDDEEE